MKSDPEKVGTLIWRPRRGIPARYVLAFLAHLGFAVAFCLRVNLSVAIVAMVNSTYTETKSVAKVDPECVEVEGSLKNVSGISAGTSGEFNWDQETQGVILSSFFYGYLLTQLPGAFAANRLGGKWVFGLGILCTAVLTIITPFASRAGPKVLVAVRIAEGLGEGVTFPAIHAMMSRWSPPSDKAKLVGIAFSGMSTGTIIAYPISGLLCKYGFAGGWPSVFYVFGIIGIIWFIFWSTLVFSFPEEHPRISAEELKLILQTTADTVASAKKSHPVPWLAILKSVPFWALSLAHFGVNWVLFMVITCLPSYLKEVLNFDIQKNGFTSALPFLFGFLCQVFAGYMADFLSSRGILGTTGVRKLATSLGTFVPCGLLIAVSYLSCSDSAIAVALMTIAVGFGGMSVAGYSVNHLDIAPNFASVLMAISNTGGTIAGCIAPLVAGEFTENEPTRGQWQKVFFLSSGLVGVGGLAFLLFASGVEQPWNRIPETSNVNVRKSVVSIPHLTEVKEADPLLD